MRSGSGRRTALTISLARFIASSLLTRSWISGTSINCWPMRMVGFNEAIGS